MKVSLYKRLTDKEGTTTEIMSILNDIKSGQYKEEISKVRLATTKQEKTTYKTLLPAFTASGIFNGSRTESSLISHSGLLQIDVDNDLTAISNKNKIYSDKFIYCGFISPSGNGLKLIVKIPPVKEKHKMCFNALCEYLDYTYNLQTDKSVKDISRLLFVSDDPELYIKENSEVFSGYEASEIIKPELIETKPDKKNVPQEQDKQRDVEKVITEIEAISLDITKGYDNWLKIGFALSSHFGEAGREYYHRISRFYPGYDKDATNAQFDECIKQRREGVNIESFFYYAKEHGIDICPAVKIIKKPAEVIDNRETPDKEIVTFYFAIVTKNNIEIGINYNKFFELLYSWGFRRFDIGKDYIFIRIKDNVIEEVTPTQIQDCFIKYLKNQPDILDHGIKKEELINKFYKSPQTYFCDTKLSLLVPEEKIHFNVDNKDECYIYYNNGFVCCNKDGYELKPYSQLKDYLWENQILNRSFEKIDEPPAGVFKEFIFNVSNKDTDRFNVLCSVTGYELHSFFDTKLKALILTDSKISDEPNGRTGKTLYSEGLGQIKPYCEINGKDFDFNNKHKYQKANLDTQMVHLNDLRNKIDFQYLYNDITEGISVEKKNKQPFRQRVKLILSTNRTIKIEGSSSKDRAIEFEFSEHYSDKYFPEHDFPGKRFFSNDKSLWNDNDWMQFDNFMSYCICYYLKNGLLQPMQINLDERKLIEETNDEFIEFIKDQLKSENIALNIEYDKKLTFEKFIEEYPEYKDNKRFDQRLFTKYLKIFARYTPGINERLDERKSGNQRLFKFMKELRI